MQSKIMRRAVVAAVLGLSLTATARVDAALFTYTETFLISGSVGTTTFRNALATFTQTADTSFLVTGFGGTGVQNLTATFSVAGVRGTFTEPTYTSNFLNRLNPPSTSFYFGAGTIKPDGSIESGGAIIVSLSLFGDYLDALTTPTGPLIGFVGGGYITSYSTTAGTLRITGTNPVARDPTFQSVGSPPSVPEPTSALMTGLGFLCAVGYRCRRRALT